MNNTINSFVLIGILFIFVFWSIFVNLVSSQNKMSSIGSVQVLDKHCWELVYINSTGTVQVWHKHFGGGVDFWVHYVYSMWHLVGIFFIFCPWSIYYLFVHIVVPPYIIGLTLLAKGGTGTMSLRKKSKASTSFPLNLKTSCFTSDQIISTQKGYASAQLLSKPQPIFNSTIIQPKLCLTSKWICIPHHHHPVNPQQQKVQLGNISAVTKPNWIKL